MRSCMFDLVVRIFISSSISWVVLLGPTCVNAINQQSKAVVPLFVNIHQIQVRTLEPLKLMMQPLLDFKNDANTKVNDKHNVIVQLPKVHRRTT